MADTVQITAGSGTVIGTDEVSIGGTTQHVQRVKLVDGTNGGTDLLAGSADNGLVVDARSRFLAVTVTPTIGTTAYTAGDCIGGEQAIAGATRAAGTYSAVRGWRVTNKAANSPAITAVLCDRALTANAGAGKVDNDPFDPDDADLPYIMGTWAMGAAWNTFADNQVSTGSDLFVAFKSVATTAYLYLVTTGTPTMASTSDITVTVYLEHLT